MKSPLFACLLLLALGTPARGAVAPAADTLRLTLDDAVTRAVQYGDEARVARAGVNIAEGQVREAFAAALPQVSGTLTYNRKFD